MGLAGRRGRAECTVLPSVSKARCSEACLLSAKQPIGEVQPGWLFGFMKPHGLAASSILKQARKTNHSETERKTGAKHCDVSCV